MEVTPGVQLFLRTHPSPALHPLSPSRRRRRRCSAIVSIEDRLLIGSRPCAVTVAVNVTEAVAVAVGLAEGVPPFRTSKSKTLNPYPIGRIVFVN